MNTATLSAFEAALWDVEHALLLDVPAKSRATAERKQHALTIQANFEGLGFVLRPSALIALMRVPVDEQAAFYDRVWPRLVRAVGARCYQPMYPNFPQQVMDASDAELLFNQLIHYLGDWFGQRWLPHYPEAKRPPLREKTAAPRQVELLTSDQARERWQRWCAATAAWSPTTAAAVLAGLEWALERDGQAVTVELSQGSWVNRENKATMMAGVLNALGHTPVGWPWPDCSINDGLRLAVALCGGDVSLAAPTRFRFARAARRAILAVINAGAGQARALEDVHARRETWLRLGEALHPAEKGLADRFPAAADLFRHVRELPAPPSWAARLDSCMSTAPSAKAERALVDLMIERPGLATRHLRRLIHWASPSPRVAERVLDTWADLLPSVPTALLLAASHALVHANAGSERVVMPKGGTARMMVTSKPAHPIEERWSHRVDALAEAELVRRFRTLPPLGKVYIDPALAKIPVPQGLRSGSKSLVTVSRGARLDLDPKAAVVRLFVWWNERHPDGSKIDRVDLDLSCVVFDASFRQVAHCAFTDLRSIGLTHSGDITSAPNGASEFVDIEPAKLPHSSRYVAMVVSSYTGQKYADLPEAFAGWMSRRAMKSGEIFEPRTVLQRLDLTCEHQVIMPMVVDLANREVVWLDMPYQLSAGPNAVVRQLDTIADRVRALMAVNRPSLHRLFTLHAQARGTVVATPDEADMVCSVLRQGDKPGVAAVEVDAITSQWLVSPA